MLSILAAVAIALPAYDTTFSKAVKSDVPLDVYKTDLAGVWYEALVDPQGRIESCIVRVAVSDAEAGNKVCKVIEGRRVGAAKDLEGKPAYGYFRGTVSLADSPSSLPKRFIRPDFTIFVSSMPSGREETVRVELIGMVDDKGELESCQAAGSSSEFAKVACDRIRGQTMPVLKNAAGQAVPYVYPLSVEFQREG